MNPRPLCNSILTTLPLFALALSAHAAATVTWNSASGGDWNTGGNWSPNKPATVDTALFNTATLAVTNTTADQTVTSISFDTAVSTFTLGSTGGNKLTLSNAGTIQILATLSGTGKTITVNAPLVLTPGSPTGIGAYTLSNNSADSTNTLNFGGPISSSTTTNTTTLTLGGANTGANTISGPITNGSAATFAITKNGAGTWILTGANNYNGLTKVDVGTLQVSGASGANGGAGAFTIASGATLILDNTSANNNNRLGDGVEVDVNAAANFIYKGSASGNSTETMGQIKLGVSTASAPAGTVTISYGGTNTAVLTASSLFRNPTGTLLVNGVNLGKDTASTSNVGRLIVTAAPTLIGGTADAGTGINSSVKNAQIVSYLLGEAAPASGGLGTATGTANTFLTYNAGSGLRPLNPTDEFTNNAIPVTGTNNIYITASTSGTATAVINSLVINGGDLFIDDGVIVTNTTGAMLFVASNAVKASGSTGTLNFGGSEAIVTVNPGVSGTIGTVIAGSNASGFTKSGLGSLTLAGNNTYTGKTTLVSGTLALTGSNSGTGGISIQGGELVIGSSNAIPSGSTLTFATASIPLSTSISSVTLGCPIALNASPALFGSAANTGNLVLTGTLTSNNANRTLQAASGVTVTISGFIANTTSPAITFAGPGSFVLGSSNAFSGGAILGSTATVSVGNKSALGSGALTITGIAGGPGATLQATADMSGINAIANNWTMGTVSNGIATIGGTNNIQLSGSYTGPTNNATEYLANNLSAGALLTLSGPLGLNSSGTSVGTTVLSGSGNTTVSGIVMNGASSGAQIFTIANTGTTTLSGTVASTGAFSQTGAGTVNLTGTINGPSGVTINNPSAVFNESATGAIKGTSTAFTLTNGTANLTVPNSYGGGTTLTAGLLILGDKGALGSGSLALNGGALTALSPLTGANAFANPVTLGGNVTVQGANSVELSGTILQTSNRTLTNNISGGSSLIVSGPVVSNGSYTFTGAGSGLTTISGLVSATNAITYAGSGTMQLTNPGNTFIGVIKATSGKLKLAPTGGSLTSANAFQSSVGGIIEFAGDPGNNNTLADATGLTNSQNMGANLFTSGTWNINSGNNIKSDFVVDGASVIVNGGATRLNFTGAGAAGTVAFNMKSGSLTTATSATYGFRANCYNGSTTGASVNFSGTQSGGVITINSAGGTTEGFSLGGTSSGVISSYTMTGGTMNVLGTGANGYISLGADAAGSGTTTFNLSGGRLYASSTIEGTIAGGNQLFNFTGGSLAAAAINATNLRAPGDSSNGTFTENGTGALLDVTANSTTVTGNFALLSGSVQIGTGRTLTVTGALNGSSSAVISGITSGTGTLSAAPATSSTFAGIIQDGSGKLALTKSGTGTLTLTGPNTYTGTTTISAGTLQIGDSTTGNDSSIASASIVNQSALNYNIFGSQTCAGAISGTGSVSKFGAGTLTLTGSNSYTGATNVNGGALQIGDGTSGGFSASSAVSVNSGATLAINLPNNSTFGGGITTSSGATVTALSSGTTIFSNNIIGPGGFNQNGSGTTILRGNNSFAGITNINAGAIQLDGVYAAYLTTVNAGVDNGLLFNYNTPAVGGLSGSGNVALSNGTNAVTLTVGGNDTSTTYTGALSGSGSLTKTGAGTLALAGANTYTGATTITNGTLQVNGSLAAESLVAVGAAGTLAGTGTVNGNVTLTGGAINLGNGGTIGGTLTVTGGYWNGSGSVTGTTTSSSGVFTIGSGANLTAAGGLSISGGTLVASDSTSTITGNVSYTSASSGTFGGVIAGSGNSLTMNKASSTLALTGLSTYTGSTFINAGTLSVSNIGNAGTPGNLGAALNSGTQSIQIKNSGVLSYTGNGETTDRNILLYDGIGYIMSVASNGAGALNLSGTVAGRYANATAGAEWFVLGGTNTGANTISGAIIEGGWANHTSVSKQGTGTWVLSGAKSYQAVTDVQNGILQFDSIADSGSACALGLGSAQYAILPSINKTTSSGLGTATVPYQIALGSASTSGVLQYTGSANGSSNRQFGLNGNGAVSTASSAGTLSLGGTIAPVVSTNVALTLDSNNTGVNTVSGVIADLPGASATVNPGSGANVILVPSVAGFSIGQTLTGAGLAANTIILGISSGKLWISPNTAGVTSGMMVTAAGSQMTVTKTGTGAWTLSGNNTYTGLTTVSAGTLTLSGSNNGTGGVTLSAGQLNINNSCALGAPGAGTLGIFGGTLDNTSAADVTVAGDNPQAWNGDFTYAGSLHSLNLGMGAVALGASRTVTVNANTLTVGGTIDSGTNSYGLTKLGAGTLKLTGSNSYSGGTTVNSGMLQIGNANALGTGGLTVNGGVAELAQSATIAAVSIGASGTVSLVTHSGSTSNVLDTSSLAFSGTSGSVDFGNAMIVRATDLAVTALGDLNADGIVDGSDYGYMDHYFQSTLSPGDLNGNGSDYGFQTQVYSILNGSEPAVLQAASAISGAGTAPASPEAVPEPGSLGLLVAGVSALLGFRRQRRAR